MDIPTLKVVLLGDLGVGKTCMRSQFVHHIFTSAYKATIGGDYLTTSVEVEITDQETLSNDVRDKRLVNLQIWDTAGQERFNSISQAYYRGTDIVILIYDISNYESVLSLRNWFKTFIEHCHVSNPGVMLVGNKADKQRCVDLEEIREIVTNNIEINVDNYIMDWDLDLMEISSKKLNEVDIVFKRVAQLGLKLMNKDTPYKKITSFDSIDLNHQTIKGNCFC